MPLLSLLGEDGEPADLPPVARPVDEEVLARAGVVGDHHELRARAIPEERRRRPAAVAELSRLAGLAAVIGLSPDGSHAVAVDAAEQRAVREMAPGDGEERGGVEEVEAGRPVDVLGAQCLHHPVGTAEDLGHVRRIMVRI